MSSYSITVDGKPYSVQVVSRAGNTIVFSVNGRQHSVVVTPVTATSLARSQSDAPASASLSPELRAPMPGIISEVKVREGQQVELGDTIVVIEAMKMENPIRAPRSAIVSAVKVAKGQEVQGGAVLVEFS